MAKLLSGPVLRVMHPTSVAKRELLIAMFKDADSRFMHWTLQAILRWQPTPLEGISIFQIHGDRDPLIPASRVQADVVIPNGGHLINLTHAEEVNDFLACLLKGSKRVQ